MGTLYNCEVYILRARKIQTHWIFLGVYTFSTTTDQILTLYVIGYLNLEKHVMVWVCCNIKTKVLKYQFFVFIDYSARVNGAFR